MRKVVLFMSVSLDGYIEGPNRELDWHLVDEEVHSHFNEVLRGMGAFLDGGARPCSVWLVRFQRHLVSFARRVGTTPKY